MVIAGSDRTTRRRVGRRLRDPAFFPFGDKLRRAREARGLTLEALGDRTGVLPALLHRLEDGDLSRFPDERSALVAVRRYADSLGLDAAFLAQQVDRQWRHVTAGSGPDLTGLAAGRPEVPALVGAGHTSRYPGDTSHLQAFTQTAQVPRVGTVGGPGPRFDTTDAVPVTWRGPHDPPAAPLGLRVAIWATVVLLVLAGVGLAVDHWHPSWLAKLHLVSASPGTPARTSRPTTPGRSPAPEVATTQMAPGAATVRVRAGAYTVVVATQAPCWIRVTTTPGAAPLFSATVPAGTTKTFASAGGRLTVELGASHVLMSAQIAGHSVPGWYFGPPSAPYTVTFHSASS